jgi:hypothetical protein
LLDKILREKDEERAFKFTFCLKGRDKLFWDRTVQLNAASDSGYLEETAVSV